MNPGQEMAGVSCYMIFTQSLFSQSLGSGGYCTMTLRAFVMRA